MRVGNEVALGIVGQYGVEGSNESSQRLLEMCEEQILVFGKFFRETI